MNRTREISLESLNLNNDHNGQQRGEYDHGNQSAMSNRFSISLDDLYDNISLYEYDPNDSKSGKRLTWTEWYLKKKIEHLKNEKLLREKMNSKMELNGSKYRNFSEGEKKRKISQWLNKKREEKFDLEEKLRRVQEENRIKQEKKEAEKIKAEEKYREWLDNLKRKEQSDKEKRDAEERRQKWKAEQEKLRRKQVILQTKESQKVLVKVRPLTSKKGKAIVNGKLIKFNDWSTSPDPSFINRVPWQS